MRQNLPNVAIFVLLAGGLTAGWWYVNRTFFPKPPSMPPREALQAIAGANITMTELVREWPITTRFESAIPHRETALALTGNGVILTEPIKDWRMKSRYVPEVIVVPEVKATKTDPVELVELGGPNWYKRVLLTTEGGGVQQVTLSQFDEANRLGRDIKREDGSLQNLRLIPGVIRPRDKSLKVEAPFPDLLPGQQKDRSLLAEPSYVLLHYPSDDDPLFAGSKETRMNSDYPSPELGDRNWTLVEKPQAGAEEQRAVFETTLGAPYHLKLRKTFTLTAKEYHLGFHLEIQALPGRQKDKGKFRYQVVGARNLQVEGEWYNTAYRNVMVGWQTSRGAAKREIEDAASIHNKFGGNVVLRGESQFTYAAVASQYFASAIAIDDTQNPNTKGTIWERVRPTREPHSWDDPGQLFIADVTVRAISSELDLAPGDSVSHKYLIYNGPIKVRLLKMLKTRVDGKTTADLAVNEELVDRYLDKLTLRTLSDYHSPNIFGRIADFIYWSDLVITFTNLMHWVLGKLNSIVPIWGLDIILLTVMVRLMLMIPSKKQQATMMKMQEKMAAMKPELDKLEEKYKDNPQLKQQEKARLMFQHGVNPLATMGGCVLLFAQMPIFMGLYFCLQESVFFRHEAFLWFPNLSAPDMTLWWSESIPFFSTPESLGGMFYLGPFLNVLPLISVTLIFLQQKLTMPPPTDEQQEMQQRMMKIMVFMMAIFFYRVPSGLCLYFICSTGWALIERQLISKSKPKDGDTPPSEPEEPKAPGFLGRMRAKMQERLENLQKQADEQSKRQIVNEPRTEQRESKKNKKKKK
jgi:YidC/Oxa1 family membrane protein insertase